MRAGPKTGLRRSTDLDVLCRLESVELVQQFEHCPLDLRVASSGPALSPARADRVNLVHEDDAGRVLPGHDKELADHARAFANVLLHELGPRDADELAVRVVRDCAGEERLACSWGPVQQDTLWLRNAERLEQLGVLDGCGACEVLSGDAWR